MLKSALHSINAEIPELEDETFGELEDAIGPDGISDVIVSFREEMQARIARITEAFASGDTAIVGSEAHAIKGAAATIGLAKFSRMASDIELAARDAPTDCFARDINTLRACYHRSMEAIHARSGSANRPAPLTQHEKFSPS